ncbi:hypothetical protein E2I00_002846, partial [Balaenoptera physalus]
HSQPLLLSPALLPFISLCLGSLSAVSLRFTVLRLPSLSPWPGCSLPLCGGREARRGERAGLPWPETGGTGTQDNPELESTPLSGTAMPSGRGQRGPALWNVPLGGLAAAQPGRLPGASREHSPWKEGLRVR